MAVFDIQNPSTYIFIAITICFVVHFVLDALFKFQKIDEAVDTISQDKLGVSLLGGSVPLNSSANLLKFMSKANKYALYDEYRQKQIDDKTVDQEKVKAIKTVFGSTNTWNAVRWSALFAAIVLIHVLLIIMAYQNNVSGSSRGSSKVTPAKGSKR